MNKIPLGVMTSNSHQGKSFTPRNRWGSNIFPKEKGNYYIDLPPSLSVGVDILIHYI